MADQLPDPRKSRREKKRSGKKAPKIPEFVERLNQISAAHPITRLSVDLAMDAGVEIFEKQVKQIRRLMHELGKMRKKRDRLYNRMVGMLHNLTTGPLVLPRPAGQPAVEHDQMLQTFKQFKETDFPALAQTLHERIGLSDVAAFQRFLVDEILIRGSRYLVEHLIRQACRKHTAEEEGKFAGQLRDHMAGKICNGLTRKVSYHMTADVGQDRDRLIDRVLTFLGNLLTATPPGRLLVAMPGSPFVPEHHEPIHGRPSSGELLVTATLFPGYIVLDTPERVLEKALVYTERVGGK